MSTDTATAPAPEVLAFEAALKDARALYMSAPYQAFEHVRDALAALGASATMHQRASAAKVMGHGLLLAGQFREALQILTEALVHLTALDEGALRVDLLRALGMVWEQMGDLEEGLRWFSRAAEAARALGQAPRLADALLSAGVVRSRSGDHAGGLAMYREALGIYRAAGEDDMAVSALMNMGIGYKNLGQFEESVAHLAEAEQLATRVQIPGMQTMVWCNLAEPLMRLGRTAEALDTIENAIQRLEGTQVVNSLVHAVAMRGQVLLALGRHAEATAALEEALARAQASGSRNHLSRIHEQLSLAHKAAGRFEAALAAHEAFHAEERAQFNENSARTLNALKVRFDLERAQHEAELQRLKAEQLAELTRTDALTGLANRRRLDEHLAEAFQRTRRAGQPLAVAMCDIDNFKRINDVFGHGVGDSVLRLVAQHLRQACRQVDLVARYGGEEFCMVFAEADAALAERACERAREAVEQQDWSGLHPSLRVTISIGLADHPSLDSPQALLADADAQLYAAKRAGKNRVSRFS